MVKFAVFSVLLIVFLLLACSPGTVSLPKDVPSAIIPESGTSRAQGVLGEWDKLIEASKKEKKVVVYSTSYLTQAY